MGPVLVSAGILLFSLQSYGRPKSESVNKAPVANLQVNYSDANNLFKASIRTTGSFDPDGSIVKTEINMGDGSPTKQFDGQFVKKDLALNYSYAKPGRYTVKMTQTDNKGLAASVNKIFDAIEIGTLSKMATVFGPQKYKASSNTYTESIVRTSEQVKDLYRITIKNGDGKEYLEQNCAVLSFVERLKCFVRNIHIVAYKSSTRVRDLNLVINNENVVRSEEFDVNTSQLVKFVRLSESNQIRLRVQGLPFASVEMVIEQMSQAPIDTKVPTLASSIKSDAVVNSDKIQIRIIDESSVTAKVFKGSLLIATHTTKEFEIPLVEGSNSFSVNVVDAFGNKSQTFYLKNIWRDSKAPRLSSSISSNSVVKFNKVKIIVADQSPVSTQIFRNGTLVSTQSGKTLDLTLLEGVNNFLIKSIDAAQNKSEFILSNVVLDTTAPKITSSLSSNTVTNINKIKITITDSTNVTTQVFKNGTLIETQKSKSFDLVLSEGLNNFVLKSTDQAQNKAADFALSNITLDTVAPKLTSSIGANTITRVNKLFITVTDASTVSTQVYKNGSLVSTQTAKAFELTLTEGVNNFTLKTTDAAQNKAADLNLSNIILDTVAPMLSSSAQSNTVVRSSKVQITIVDSTAVTTQVYKNGLLTATLNVKSFELTLTEGLNNFTLKSVDAIGNQAMDFVLSNITLKTDVVAPVLTASIGSGVATNNSKINVSIADESNVTTQIYRNGVLVGTEQNKTFDLVLTEGINNFVLKATDAAQNAAADFTLNNITLDTMAPKISSNVVSGTVAERSTIHIEIEDISSVMTEVYRDGHLILAITQNSFDLELIEGTNNFLLKSTDAFGNGPVEYALSNIYFDRTGPVLASDIGPYSYTRNNKIHITVIEQSATTTEVMSDGSIVKVTEEKEFDISLTEGLNNFEIKSTDSSGNTAALALWSITLDTENPNILTGLKNQYQFSLLPQLETITVELSEQVSSLSLNGKSLIQVGPFTYSYTIQFDEPGTKNFTYVAVDLAGNETILQQSVDIIVDNGAPVITTNSIPSVIGFNYFDIEVTISDGQNVTTQLFVDDVLTQTFTTKQFTYRLNFDEALQVQSKKATLVATDAAGNSSNKQLVIVKDLSPLLIQIISPQNHSILNSTVVEVRARANKPLVAAKVNHQVVTIGSDQISVKAIVQQPADGKFSVLVEVTDIYGAQSSHEIQAEIKSNSLPSWTYEECPIQ